jgi:hypothetical protein
MTLNATLSVATDAPTCQKDPAEFEVILSLTNRSDAGTTILNPDMGVPAPAMHWPFSQEVYRTSLLLSYGYLSLTVTGETGDEPPREPIETWATPVLRSPLELAPGDSLQLPIPIGAFYRLERGRVYDVTVTYGDQAAEVSAKARVTVP